MKKIAVILLASVLSISLVTSGVGTLVDDWKTANLYGSTDWGWALSSVPLLIFMVITAIFIIICSIGYASLTPSEQQTN
ncbi:MAG: hypothetical protein WC819_02260 [Parcubacteria group bacterium]|jgi:hypothetical protein